MDVNFQTLFYNIMRENGLDFAMFAPQFFTLTEVLTEVNRVTNLTAIRDIPDIILKHYADSLLCERYIPKNAVLLDVGAGAGFPSLPLAIVRPDIKVTSLDSTAKKLEFIRFAAEKLNLSNIRTLNARAEDAAHNPLYREKFDIVCARAVARLNILCELCLPLAKKDGKFIALKGAEFSVEMSESENALSLLYGKICHIDEFSLSSDLENQKRGIIIIQKNKPTPTIYPRNFAQINKKPL